MLRKVLIGLGVVVGLLVIGGLVMFNTTADLRPDGIGDAVSAEREAEGRKWLQRSVEAHGGAAALAAHRDARITGTVAFVTWMGRTMVNPFEQDEQGFALDLLLGTDDVRLTQVGGPNEGRTWGVQQWTPWQSEKGGEVQVVADAGPDAPVRFWPPTVAYFLFMPWRIAEAPVVQFVDERTVDGKRYGVVFATWGGLEPRDGVDQYLVYIDAETGLMRWSVFTVRDFGGFMTGGVELADHEQVDGLTLPRLVRTTNAPGDPETASHEIRVSKFVLGPGRPDEHYRPRPELRGEK